MTNTFEITLKGASFGDVIAQAKQLVEAAESFQGPKTAKPTTVKTKRGKTAPAVEEDEIELADEAANAGDDDLEGLDADESEDEETEEADDELSFDDDEDEEVEAPAKTKPKGKTAPAATAKAKTKEVDPSEVNKAAMAHAKKFKRAETMKLLKKHFGVQSVGEIKKEDRAKALKVLSV